mmetsp:Transcript_6526/g.17484  ORF Transcript_6526/g.17484 Transcript_6526/m.17484 type:complete len:498 (+) Transcript_6526:36-1529(+)
MEEEGASLDLVKSLRDMSKIVLPCTSYEQDSVNSLSDCVGSVQQALERIQIIAQDAEQLQWLMSTTRRADLRQAQLAHAIVHRSSYFRDGRSSNPASRERPFSSSVSSSSSSASRESVGDGAEQFVSTTIMIPVKSVGSDVLLHVLTDSATSPSWCSAMSANFASVSPAVLRSTTGDTFELIAFSRCMDDRDKIAIAVSDFSGSSLMRTRLEMMDDTLAMARTTFPSLLSRLEVTEITAASGFGTDANASGNHAAKVLNENHGEQPGPKELWARFRNALSDLSLADVRVVSVSDANNLSSTAFETFTLSIELLETGEKSFAAKQSHSAFASLVQNPHIGALDAQVLDITHCNEIALALDAMQSLNRIESWFSANKELHETMLAAAAACVPGSPFTPHNAAFEKLRLHCVFCHQRFKRHHDARRHEREKHNEMEARRCPDCQRKFSRESNLRRHRFAVHERKRMHVCKHCDTSFSTRGNLVRHLGRLHKSELNAMFES